jgi:hypothetical protein
VVGSDGNVHGRRARKESARHSLLQAPPEIADGLFTPYRELSEQARATIYCLVIKEMTWTEVEELLRCGEWAIKTSIHRSLEALCD